MHYLQYVLSGVAFWRDNSTCNNKKGENLISFYMYYTYKNKRLNSLLK